MVEGACVVVVGGDCVVTVVVVFGVVVLRTNRVAFSFLVPAPVGA